MLVQTLFKSPVVRDKKYKTWIKRQKCINCPSRADDPHHVKIPFHGGMATTPGDDRCLPVCRTCHDIFERDRSQLNRLDPERLIRQFNAAYETATGRKIGEKTGGGKRC